jgi:hypothetical protein
MSKRPDALQGVFTVASVLLALRGEDADVIGARALAVARAAEDARNKLEAFVMANVRRHVGCSQPGPCSCLVCSAYEAEHAKKKTKASKAKADRERLS